MHFFFIPNILKKKKLHSLYCKFYFTVRKKEFRAKKKESKLKILHSQVEEADEQPVLSVQQYQCPCIKFDQSLLLDH